MIHVYNFTPTCKNQSMKPGRTKIVIGLGACFLSCFTPLPADQTVAKPHPSSENLPWLTGPLIASTGTAVQGGHYTVQTYAYLYATTGTYNAHWKSASMATLYNATLLLQIQIGLTKFMDFQLLPTGQYSWCRGQSSTEFADLPFLLDFQLLDTDKYPSVPGIKLQITETFPTGKYDQLSPKKRGTQISGMGSYSTAPAIVLYKVVHFGGVHYMSITGNIEYAYFAPVDVRGLNFYGGGKGTRGRVYPGSQTTAIVSFEYTLTKNWVLALDNVYIHTDKDRFRGKRGAARVGRSSSEQISFAPAIEYNFNTNWGIIAGSWFTAAGRNTPKFYSGIFSFSYSY